MVRKYSSVECKVCKKTYPKRMDSIKCWNGLCKKCSNKEVANRDEIKAKKSISAKEQIKRLGNIPNGNRFKSVPKELSQNWKGGKPKCSECSLELSAYTSKICKSCLYKSRRGENHPQWKGGLTPINETIRKSKEYNQWRRDVFKRDSWSCVKCGYRSNGKSDLRADHIKPFHLYIDLRLDVTNGRTLCIECDKVHGYNYHRDKNKPEYAERIKELQVSRSIN